MEIFCLPDCSAELIQIAAKKNILNEDMCGLAVGFLKKEKKIKKKNSYLKIKISIKKKLKTQEK